MPDPSDRLSNLLGALALGLADRVRWVALDETGLGGEAAAALVLIGYVPEMSIHGLSDALRLSHPGAVRLVDRLERSGLAARGAARHDRRAVSLALTDAGSAARTAILSRRRNLLNKALETIPARDRHVLERVAEAVLRTLPDDATSALTICRFCDGGRCPDCPMNAFVIATSP